MTYSIHENNIPRLVEKLKKVANKCSKYGLTFKYEEVGEEFKTVENHMERFVVVEVEGLAVINDWCFVATLEHAEAGNIIRSCNPEIEIPEYFRTCAPKCDHCNSARHRKDTYIVQNVTTGELKQVGKSCLKDYTNGWSAEAIASYMSYFNTIEEYNCNTSFGGGFATFYYGTKEVILAAIEITSKVGFVSKQKACDDGLISTTAKLVDFMSIDPTIEIVRAKEAIGYNPNTEVNNATANTILEWLNKQESDSEYINNLQMVCKKAHLEYRDLGLVASLPAAYHKATVRAEENKKRIEESKSMFVGAIKERIVIENVSLKCIARYGTDYGVTKVYHMLDAAGNIYVWKSANCIEDTDSITIKGTVKAHSEFRGEKQTELTRCKVQ